MVKLFDKFSCHRTLPLWGLLNGAVAITQTMPAPRAVAVRLAQLRAEERSALSRGDSAALQEIGQSIVRELAWEKA